MAGRRLLVAQGLNDGCHHGDRPAQRYVAENVNHLQFCNIPGARLAHRVLELPPGWCGAGGAPRHAAARPSMPRCARSRAACGDPRYLLVNGGCSLWWCLAGHCRLSATSEHGRGERRMLAAGTAVHAGRAGHGPEDTSAFSHLSGVFEVRAGDALSLETFCEAVDPTARFVPPVRDGQAPTAFLTLERL